MGKESGAHVLEGLQDVPVTTSEICFIDGERGRLLYRGIDVEDLAAFSTYEETVFLLCYGHLPSRAELVACREALATERALGPEVLAMLRGAPKDALPMAVLRTAVSMMAHTDPDAKDDSHEANLRKALRLIGSFPTAVAALGRIREGREPVEPRPDLSLAANFLWMLHGHDAVPIFVRALETALILHAEHELNASTFAARLTASTLAHLHAAIASAMAALSGPLHGGANERVIQTLLVLKEVSAVAPYLKETLARGERVMGFGHRVYKGEDPRAFFLRQLADELGMRTGTHWIFELAREMEAVMWETKHLRPNVDFYAAPVYYSLGIPIELFTPVFAMSRMSGWCAHVLEQYAHNRLIRPRAEYVGKRDVPYLPMDDRGP